MAKLIALVSGGIDSAVSTALALEGGAEVVAVHFQQWPFADAKAEEKTRQLLALLAKKFHKKIRLLLVPHGAALTAIAQNCDRKFNCVLCRRMMLKVAERIAREEGASALLTGESLGQVASQTLSNLNAEFGAIKIPIVRPLLGMDKLEIEALAKKLGTYETSILPSACCSIPEKPATKATRARAGEEEKKFDVKGIAEKSFAGRRAIEIEG